jgi:hypothetical protein
VGGGGSPGRGAARRGQDPQAGSTKKDGGVSGRPSRCARPGLRANSSQCEAPRAGAARRAQQSRTYERRARAAVPLGLWRFRRRRRGHLVVHMVVMMMMMVVMVVMMHLMGHRSGGRRRWGGFLRNGVSRQADRENGGGDKTLDHGEDFQLSIRPLGSSSRTMSRRA